MGRDRQPKIKPLFYFEWSRLKGQCGSLLVFKYIWFAKHCTSTISFNSKTSHEQTIHIPIWQLKTVRFIKANFPTCKLRIS